MIVLKTISKETRSLPISLLPQSPALKHRKREPSVVAATDLSPMIQTARKELIRQIEQRFINKRFSDARLIQIYMSKQMDASKVLSEESLQKAKALYLQSLRLLISKGVLGVYGERTSPRKKKKMDLFEGMADSDDDEDNNTPAAAGDRVRTEVQIWESLLEERINSFKDKFGLVDEFKLVYAMRNEAPLHAALFKQVARAALDISALMACAGMLSPCYPVTLLPCYPVTLLPCYPVIALLPR